MARIVGIELPPNKKVEIALTYIYGVGRTLSNKIIFKSGISPTKKAKELTEKEIETIRRVLETECRVEGVLRSEITENIKRLISIGSYRGSRHKKGLPARGQRTRTNARTRKGPSKGAIALKRKGTISKKG